VCVLDQGLCLSWLVEMFWQLGLPCLVYAFGSVGMVLLFLPNNDLTFLQCA
jgi:hypothetical protein